MNRSLFMFFIAAAVALMVGVALNDTDQIKHVVETAFLMRGQACVESNHGSVEDYKAQLQEYWSNTPPSGNDLKLRRENFSLLYSTPEPTAFAADRATAVAEGYSPSGWDNYVFLTPEWHPDDSPFQERSSEIDSCQRRYDSPAERQPVGFGVEHITYESIVILFGQATVIADITYWSDYRDVNKDIRRVSGTRTWNFKLRREAGLWKLIEERSDHSHVIW